MSTWNEYVSEWEHRLRECKKGRVSAVVMVFILGIVATGVTVAIVRIYPIPGFDRGTSTLLTTVFGLLFSVGLPLWIYLSYDCQHLEEFVGKLRR